MNKLSDGIRNLYDHAEYLQDELVMGQVKEAKRLLEEDATRQAWIKYCEWLG
jgi:hypothetical protein